MNLFAWATIFLVAILNVALNIFASRTANQETNLMGTFISMEFLSAYLIGTLSLISLVLVYRQLSNFTSAIILLAAASTIIGSSYGIFIKKQIPDTIEIVLLAALIFIYIYRMIANN